MNGSEDDPEANRLRTAAIDSVTDAITRGRKRRPGKRDAHEREIQIGPTTSATAEQLADPGKQLQNMSYHKRRRVSLIPGLEADAEDDSNDEWEEHVDMDTDAVEAAVAELKRDAVDKEKADSNDARNDAAEDTPEVERKESDKNTTEEERKARARLRATAKRKRVLRRYSLHIVLSIANLLRLDAAANSEDMGGIVLSIAPADTILRKESFAEDLSRLGLWSRVAFQPTTMVQQLHKKDSVPFQKRLCNVVERAILCAKQGFGDIMDTVAVLAALIRIQGYRCRLVAPLQPVSHQARKVTKTKHKVTGKAKVVESRPANEAEGILYTWLEVWCPDKMKWTPFDVCEGLVSGEEAAEIIRKSASLIECFERQKKSPVKTHGKRKTPGRRVSSRLRPKSKDPEEAPRRELHPAFFTHVVAVENGVITDVTRRYTTNWTDVQKARASGRVFEKILERFQEASPPDATDEAFKLEVEEFDALAAGEEVPKTLTALQKHPRYILERHIKRYEVIHPRTPVIGYFKDEPIFLRSRVHLLHTKDRWIRKMREVMEGAKPLKVVKSKNGTEDTVDLFGEWQTVPLLIPECVNGKVPRSIHGNVDLWTPEHLPKGTVHVNLPYARIAARRLGVDFAPAMTGFEPRRGRPVPKIEGVVVAEENAELIRDAARSAAQAALERQVQREREETREREEKAAREAKAREKVQKRYGGMLEDAGSYEQVQKREGLRKAREEKHGKEDVKASDGQRDEKGSSVEKPGKSEAHEHEYGRAKRVKGDTWKKTCKICGLDVSFEKL